MAEDKESEGKRYMAEADVKLNASTGSGCCKSKSFVKLQDAVDLYVKAANSFKMAKNWTQAGNAFAEAAALQLKEKRVHEAASFYAEASKCYKKENAEESLKCLMQAIAIYTDMGRVRVAAKHHMTAAEMNEEIQDIPNAIAQYEMAAELFQRDESKIANKCLLKVAEHSALIDDYEKAIQIYENVGPATLENSLLRYCATDLFLRAALCHMCVDINSVNSGLLDRYEQMNPAFEASRERTLIRTMAQMVTEKDLDGFNEAIRTYESVTVLSTWHHEIIKKIRKRLIGHSDLR